MGVDEGFLNEERTDVHRPACGNTKQRTSVDYCTGKAISLYIVIICT